MTEDEMRAALAERLLAMSGPRLRTVEQIANALLPTVRRIVAEELRTVAQHLREAGWYGYEVANTRADALDGQK